MKGSLFLAELKAIIKNPKSFIQVSAIVLIPILYAGMFIWAFWDPYGQLEKLPVAVVNEDSGATMNGKKIEIGNELVKKLKDEKNLDFHFVNREKAYNGLDNQTYYMVIEIPDNFSENATTLMDDQPKPLDLKYVLNESANYTSSKIGESAMTKMKAAVSKDVTATFSEEMFDAMKEMADGYTEASDGASKLNAGAEKLKDGTKSLKENLEILASSAIGFQNGINEAKSGSGELASGASDLASGMDQLVNGHKQIVQGAEEAKKGSKDLASGAEKVQEGVVSTDNGMKEITSKTKELETGAAQLSEKLQEFKDGAGTVAKGADAVYSGISQLKKELEPMLSSLPEDKRLELSTILDSLEKGSGEVATGTENLGSASEELTNGAATLSQSIGALNEGQSILQNGIESQLIPGINKLRDGAAQLYNGQTELNKGITTFDQKLSAARTGANQLATGVQSLNGGMDQLADGSAKLGNGTNQLAAGSKELNDGTNDLQDGTSKLENKLGEAAEDTKDLHADKKTYDMMGEPVDLAKSSINKVPNYGTGLAPYFLSLGLFVGTLLLTIVYQLRETAIQPKNGFTWFLGKYGVMAVVGILQSLLAVWVLVGWIGIEVKSVPLFILTAIITSLTFMALIQLLVTVLDNPGRYLAVIILILQLTSSAGTFPLELLPKVLKPIHEALPMTYTLQAFKAVISSGDYSVLWYNLGIILIYMVSFMAISIVYFIFKNRKKRIVETKEEAII